MKPSQDPCFSSSNWSGLPLVANSQHAEWQDWCIRRGGQRAQSRPHIRTSGDAPEPLPSCHTQKPRRHGPGRREPLDAPHGIRSRHRLAPVLERPDIRIFRAPTPRSPRAASCSGEPGPRSSAPLALSLARNEIRHFRVGRMSTTTDPSTRSPSLAGTTRTMLHCSQPDRRSANGGIHTRGLSVAQAQGRCAALNAFDQRNP